jgi:hypothetical protein
MPHVAPIIPHELKIGEALKHTNNMQWNSKKEECYIENVDSDVEFRWKNWQSKLRQIVALESIGLMQQHDSNAPIYEEE